MKLLITSVGSLLGQNVLDSIESRRNLLNVVGLNSIAENARNFRCDKVYLVRKVSHPKFLDEFSEIVETEKPDFILPGRDEDCVFLADFKSKHPKEFSNKIPFGSSFIPKIMLDKYESHLFCKQHKLPFADTFLYVNKDDKNGLDQFVSKYGFPLLVKPREGFGSLGVYYILNQTQLNETIKTGNVLFQEYLGKSDRILKYESVFKKGIPLFFQIPEHEQYAAQTIIHRDGTIGEIFFVVATMVFGRAESSKHIVNKEVEQLVRRFSKVFYENGWYGPVNFQLKQDRNGSWKVFELNPRLTGTSSGRVLMGYDEIGLLTDIFLPERKFPNLSKKEKVKGTHIKYLHDSLLLDKDVETLKANKVWKKS
jgi:carbamoyl-phosphate synthase large subunit